MSRKPLPALTPVGVQHLCDMIADGCSLTFMAAQFKKHPPSRSAIARAAGRYREFDAVLSSLAHALESSENAASFLDDLRSRAEEALGNMPARAAATMGADLDELSQLVTASHAAADAMLNRPVNELEPIARALADQATSEQIWDGEPQGASDEQIDFIKRKILGMV